MRQETIHALCFETVQQRNMEKVPPIWRGLSMEEGCYGGYGADIQGVYASGV